MYIISVRTIGNMVIRMISDEDNFYHWLNIIENHKDMVKFKVTTPDGILKNTKNYFGRYTKWVEKLYDEVEKLYEAGE